MIDGGLERALGVEGDGDEAAGAIGEVGGDGEATGELAASSSGG